MVEYLYQALASPKGIILRTSNQMALSSALWLEKLAMPEDFKTIQIVCPKQRPGEVWLLKEQE
jgi:hypothetical protein